MLNLKQKFDRWRINRYLKKANLFYVSEDYMNALKLYQKILCYEADNYAAYCNLATAYYEMENYSDALPMLEHLAKNDSSNPWWQTYLSKTYQNLSRFQEALDAAWSAVIISDFASEHQINLAYSFYEIAQAKGADFVKEKLKEFYQLCPDSGIAKQCYFAFNFDKNFTQDDPEYVEKMFDIFAPEFDKVLSSLNYDSPKQIACELASIINDKNTELSLLDLGCGSGLCGAEVIKNYPYCQIIGVDISALMLHQASLKNIYSQLIKKEITAYLESTKTLFDGIISADVLTYFGALDSLFLSVSHHLKSGGFFIFTISENNLNNNDYFLLSSSRFVHGFTYVENVLSQAGFELKSRHRIPLRREGEKDVIGGVFVAVKQ